MERHGRTPPLIIPLPAIEQMVGLTAIGLRGAERLKGHVTAVHEVDG